MISGNISGIVIRVDYLRLLPYKKPQVTPERKREEIHQGENTERELPTTCLQLASTIKQITDQLTVILIPT